MAYERGADADAARFPPRLGPGDSLAPAALCPPLRARMAARFAPRSKPLGGVNGRTGARGDAAARTRTDHHPLAPGLRARPSRLERHGRSAPAADRPTRELRRGRRRGHDCPATRPTAL